MEETPYDGIDQDCSGADLVDVDDDGFDSDEVDGPDCDDSDPDIHPDASDSPYDGIDQDCDGTDYVDVDEDGQASASVPGGTDCDDSDPDVYLGATEVPYDGADQDCDGFDLVDVDGDGQTSTEVLDGTDCDDSDPDVYSGATEVPYDTIDQDCSGADLVDVDGDGYIALQAGGNDCDDQDLNTYPGASEFKDEKDNDCDGVADNHLDTSDDDGDSFAEDAGDCNDHDKSIYPGAAEVAYDGIDQDCSGLDLTDVDGDGHHATQVGGDDCNDEDITIYAGASEVPYDTIDQDCSGKDLTDVDGDGFPAVEAGGNDCDDSNLNIHPSAAEVCNGIDDDCQNGVDTDAVDLITFYDDSDDDAFGDPSDTELACSQPSGMVTNALDCDDSNSAINPDSQEICNSLDDDCDTAIDDQDSTVSGQNTYYTDADQDGYGSTSAVLSCSTAPVAGSAATADDCNDQDGAIHPNQTEVCNTLDDNCNSSTDEDVQTTYYLDSDRDSFGDPSETILACSAPEGYVGDMTDCNDSNDEINPSETELCNSVDDDCDTAIDDADSSIEGQGLYFADLDNDSFGNAESSVHACSAPNGYVSDRSDCNDADAAVHPGAAEVCNGKDDDCNALQDNDDPGVTDQATFYADSDGDTFGNSSAPKLSCSQPSGYVINPLDCDDARSAVNPAATETCNGLDDDCDSLTDDSDSSISDQATFYADADNDGYGAASNPKKACSKPAGYVTDATDCNDTVAEINPAATEVCNTIDDDCDTLTDDSDPGIQGQNTYYADADNDTYGNASSSKKSCNKPSGYVSNALDCSDTSSAVNPAAVEVCNSIDDDCDSLTDDNDPSVQGRSTFYRDADSDTYGNPGTTQTSCSKPAGFVTNNTDCDDSAAAVNPAATESCNGVDDDCDTAIDNADSSVQGQATYYLDSDADGYGNASSSVKSCTPVTGYVTNSTDCNDASAAVKPGATEVCNGYDDNCTGGIDEGVKTTFYLDADGDTYGTSASSTQACSKPSGYATNATDCNDSSAAVNPGATEVCNSIDDNCTGGVDEGVKTTYYLDADGDTYGTSSSSTQACSKPTGYATNASDCNDSSASIKPGASEVCNGTDDNCNSSIDEGVTNTFYRDADGDGYGTTATTTQACTPPSGYVTSSTDCNDSNAAIKPGAAEVCNGTDDNCNSSIDEGVKTTFYRDADGDGYGTSSTTTQACSAPSGYVTNATDCNDSNANVNPGKTEVSGNSIDDNCNGQIDEVATCSSITNVKAAALAACQARFPNCYDTGSASYIGYAAGYSQGSNCTTDTTKWLQFCYVTGTDGYNCNTCIRGEMQQAHNPCTCSGENTAVVGYFCSNGVMADFELPQSLQGKYPPPSAKVPSCTEEDEAADIFEVPSAYLECNPKGRVPAEETDSSTSTSAEDAL